MTTDRELFELAAKAAGVGALVWGEKYRLGDDEIDCTDLPYIRSGHPDEGDVYWDPLTDDGDALRLAVKLGLHVFQSKHYVRCGRKTIDMPVEESKREQDPYTATRRAIVRAAAAIGKEMK